MRFMARKSFCRKVSNVARMAVQYGRSACSGPDEFYTPTSRLIKNFQTVAVAQWGAHFRADGPGEFAFTKSCQESSATALDPDR